jgi:hypothetical protein
VFEQNAILCAAEPFARQITLRASGPCALVEVTHMFEQMILRECELVEQQVAPGADVPNIFGSSMCGSKANRVPDF